VSGSCLAFSSWLLAVSPCGAAAFSGRRRKQMQLNAGDLTCTVHTSSNA
jgi:hypothetical protein